jgi:hypothetical protein
MTEDLSHLNQTFRLGSVEILLELDDEGWRSPAARGGSLRESALALEALSRCCVLLG